MALDLLGVDASRATTDQMTGTEWYSREIISALAALEDRPALRLYQRTPDHFLDGQDIEWVTIERRRLWTHTGLALQVRRSDVDALFIPSHVIPWRHPRASVATIHDLGYRFEPETHTRPRRAMLEATTRWNARRAARIIVPSEATRSDLESEYGVDPQRVDVIPHGIDHNRFKPIGRDQVERALDQLGVDGPYILFASTIQPRKNLSRLISAFESLEEPDVQLVVAGVEGWMAEPIIDQMRKSARANEIRHLGYVADEMLPALYNGAAAFVLPSLYEGFGMGVLEAMACGCPVVASSASSLPGIVGDAGILVDPHSVTDIRDGIRRALDPATAGELQELGLSRAAGYTWRRAALETLDSIRRAYKESHGA